MADDEERLVILLEARIRDLERNMAKASGVTAREFRKMSVSSKSATLQMERDMLRSTMRINQAIATVDTRIGAFGKAFGGKLTAIFAGVGSALAVNEILALADTWTELTGRVDLAAGSMEKGSQVMGRLGEMARRTYSSPEQTAESFLANATTLTELGYSTQTQLDYTEALNNALVISAAKGDRARSVMDALSKAMALGKLSGDNLNTVIASGGRVAEALAASMGVTTLELRKLGADGKITRKELIGITSELEKLREEADNMQATLSDAFVLMRNAALQYVGGADQAVGVSRQLAEAVILVADNFDMVADSAVKLGFVIASALVGRALGGMIAVIPNAVAALATMTAAMRAGTLTAVAFSAAIGPIALAAGAAAAAIYLLHDSQSDAEKAADTHEAALRELKYRIETVDYANGEAVASTRQKIAADIKAAEVALTRAKAERELAASIIREEINPSMSLLPTPEASDLHNSVENNPAVKDRQALIDTIEQQIEDLKHAQSDFEDYASGRKKPQRETDRPIAIPSDSSGKRGRRDEFEREIQQVRDRTAALQAATQAQAGLNPLIDDYGYAVEKARIQQELLNAAQKAGKQITPELQAEIETLSATYAAASADAKKLAESHSEIRKAAEEAAAFQKDLSRGIVDGFLEGKKAADILADALRKIGDRFLDLAFNSAFDAKGGGGFLSGLLGLFGGGKGSFPVAPTGGLYAKGGVFSGGVRMFAKGGAFTNSIVDKPTLFPFAKGTGLMGEAGPEAIMPLKRDASGRLGVSAAGMQGNHQASPQIKMTFAPNIDARGASIEAVERLEAAMQKQQREISAHVVEAVRKAQKSNVKLS